MASEARCDLSRRAAGLSALLRGLGLLFLLLGAGMGASPTQASSTAIFGGPGGAEFNTPCTPGRFLVGLAVHAGAWIDAVAPVCARFDGDALVVTEVGKFVGHAGGARLPDFHCKFGSGVITSLLVQATFDDDSRAKYADNLVASCSKATDLSVLTPGFQVLSGDDLVGYVKCDIGWQCLNDIRIPYPKSVLSCPTGQVATGIWGRAGNFVDALGLICGPPPSKSLAQGGQLPPAPPGGHAGFDRPGNPFNWFATNDPAECPAQCEPQAACQSWKWALADTNGVPVATCYLNRDAPPEVARPCCISGLKGGVVAAAPLPPAPAGAKEGVTFLGGDFYSYVSNDPTNCALSCTKNAPCKSWTWAVAGTNGQAQPMCYLKNTVPTQVANNCCVSGVPPTGGGLSSAGAPVSLPPGAAAGADRPGGDFFSFVSNDPANCALSCSKNAPCKAWTWAVAGTNGHAQPMCYLKNTVPTQVANNCCVSGLTSGGGAGVPAGGGSPSGGGGSASLPAGALANTDRPGGDINAIPSGDPASCEQSCGSSSFCKAWTWAVAGTNGSPQPRCYLKNVVPAPKANNCCVSGVKVAGGGSSGGGGPTGGGGASTTGAGSSSGGGASGGSSSGGPTGGGGPVFVPPGALAGVDRPGGDFTAAPSPDPVNCALACSATATCKAWTWAMPGTNGQPQALCYLKNVVLGTQPNTCCVSGLKVAGGGGSSGSGGSSSGGGPDFSGSWQTTINGSAPGTLSLFKSGSTWKGSYSAFGISGSIEKGHVGGDGHLKFSWSQPGATGKGNFVMTGPGSFKGTFYFDANPAAVGTWDGHR